MKENIVKCHMFMSHDSVSITRVIGLVLAEKQVASVLPGVDLHKKTGAVFEKF